MESITELETLIVRSDQAASIVFNPQTHTLTTAELPDGNVMVHIRPSDEPVRVDNTGPEIAG